MAHSHRDSNPAYRKVVAALAASEQRYRTLVEGVKRYAIFMLDPQGTILTWNRGIEELLGYNRDDVIGQTGAMVFNTAEAKRNFKRELAAATRDGECVTDGANIHKDGTEVMVEDTVTSLLDSEGILIGFAKVTRIKDSSDNGRGAAAALELAKALATIEVEVAHRRRLEAQLLTAVEEERERLGRDLHDDLSQRLAGIAMMTRTLAKSAAGRSTEDREKITEVGDLLADAIGVARNLARGLHPVTLTTQGLPAALAELAGKVPKQVEFNSPIGERLNVEPSVALHVYRVAEEAIGNAIKHSGADKITLELKPTSPRRAVLTIHDNGKGFSKPDSRDGMGLQNMRYRAGVIGGKLSISTGKGHGTCIGCTLPLQREPNSNS